LSRGTFALISVLTTLCLAAAAWAGITERPVEARFRAGVPHVSFSARDLEDPKVRRALESGLGKQLVVTVQAYPSGGEQAIASATHACRVTFDLWEEDYVVRIGNQHERLPSLDAVLSRCLEVRALPIGTANEFRPYAGKRVFFAVRAEFNPISRARCHGLLRSPGSADPIGPVVVNIVRREICRAEKAIEFRSADVEVPK
jgi:hypothetical protein